ncbi:hypothetical protein BJY16_006848 [Actinoplanes octamycinicus]|uniref:Uncharacterized protein n=1 Tax=Actinoplanes octamycinicus TaxID=135948 RepID=A0A7W7MAS3_9ACTN|nr:hypothetical protein [Actinoplanes octamycinicus]MBB4743389.1 hypothetical protein [Actinoplanes octamycinicus]GIE61905.1 hypothetical protein Aoc01nite_73070 [Actinoplanes octamycinicus]
MTSTDHPERPAERPSERLFRKLGLPALPPRTAEDEARIDEMLARVKREQAALDARRQSDVA